uniref:IBB domain-containing protein n=1 Tax=Daucus carota subsp. sativus TaxID=79200 RepID=A0A175YDN3_DAUCS
MSLRPSARTEVRRNRYKVAVDADEGRRRREDNMVEIRKSKREESLLKKRREGLQANQQFPVPSQSVSGLEKKLENLPGMIAGVWSDDSSMQLEATTQFRKLLSIERSPPIQEVIQSGVVPRFIEFLMRAEYPQLQAVWALGNVAGDSPKCRDFVLGNGALVPLLSQLNEHAKLSMLRNATWTLSNFCRGKPQPAFDQMRPVLPALQRLIHSNDEEVLTDACWALSYLSDGTNDKIQAVIEAGVCPRLVELLLYLVSQGCIKPMCDLLVCPDPRIVTVCLEGLENILKVGEAEKNLGQSGDVNVYAQMIDDAEGLEKIENLQSHDNNEIYEKAVKILETYWLEEDDETVPPGDGAVQQQQGYNFGGGGVPVPSGGFNFQ